MDREVVARLVDIAAKTVGAWLIPGAGGTAAGEFAAWALEKGFADPNPGTVLDIEIKKAIRKVTVTSLHRIERVLEPHDVEAAAVAVTVTLSDVSLRDPRLLLDSGLSGHRLAGLIKQRHAGENDNGLGEAAHAHDRLLEEICLRILDVILQNPVGQASMLRALAHERVQELAARHNGNLAGEMARFHDERFALEYRYDAAARIPRFEVVWPAPIVRRLPLRQIFHDPPADRDGDPGRATALFEADPGWIVSAPPGYGTTSLLRALMAEALTGGLPHWHDKVPLYLGCGEDGQFPTPLDALRALDARMPEKAPHGWAERLIADGNALLLLDDVRLDDEQHLTAALDLADEALGYGCVVVLGTHSASAPAPVRDRGLRRITLHRWSPSDVDRFIIRWHQAVAAQCATTEEKRDIVGAGRLLLSALGRCTEIRELCANPHFLGQLCREHLRGAVTLPDDAVAMVQRVLPMLAAPEPLSEAPASAGDGWDDLSELAHWSVQNGNPTFAVEAAAAGIGADRSRIHELVDAYRVLRVEPSSEITFIDPTVRDLLAAEYFAQRRFIGYLCASAADETKRRIVVSALGRSPKNGVDEFLRRLLDAAEAAGAEHRREADCLLLTARAGAHAARLIDPTVRQAVVSAASRVYPPTTAEQIAAIVATGDVMLDLLTCEVSAGTATADCVIEIARPAGKPALAAVATLAADNPGPLRDQVVAAWTDHPDASLLMELIGNRNEAEVQMAEAREGDDNGGA